MIGSGKGAEHAPHVNLTVVTHYHREHQQRNRSCHERRWGTHGAEAQDSKSIKTTIATIFLGISGIATTIFRNFSHLIRKSTKLLQNDVLDVEKLVDTAKNGPLQIPKNLIRKTVGSLWVP